jgi:hypothetical protein
MEYCDDDREYIRVVTKTEPFTPRKEGEYPNDTMEFKFQQTYTRSKLQGRAEEMRKAAEATRLWQIRQRVETYVNQIEAAILTEAGAGKSSYLHEVRNLPHDCTNDDILRGFQEKFPECTVTLAEEWVDVPNRHPGQPPTRVLKSGIKIDWS